MKHHHLKSLLDAHEQWVRTNGRKGKRGDFQSLDPRHILDMRLFSKRNMAYIRHLPHDMHHSLKESIDYINAAAQNARNLFFILVILTLFMLVTALGTRDIDLIIDQHSLHLPILETTVVAKYYYSIVPFLLLCFYLYFHLYLYKLFDKLGDMPAVFPDGKPLPKKVHPWMLNSFSWRYISALKYLSKDQKPALITVQYWVSILLAWAFVPITLLFLFVRYLPAQMVVLSLWQTAIIVLAVHCGIFFHYAAIRALSKQRYKRKRILPYTVSGLLGLVLCTIVWVGHSIAWHIPLVSWYTTHEFERHNLPLSTLFSANLFRANLKDADLRAARLRGAMLKEANLSGADLRGADLRGAYLREATLSNVRLRSAQLQHANLVKTNLTRANLEKVFLDHTNIKEAILTRTTLKGTDLKKTNITKALLSQTNLHDTNLSHIPCLKMETLGLTTSMLEIRQKQCALKKKNPNFSLNTGSALLNCKTQFPKKWPKSCKKK